MRRLRVLSGHPLLGKPNDEVPEFQGAQAYVEAGLAEWIVDRVVPVETGMRLGAAETTAANPAVAGAGETDAVLRARLERHGVKVDGRWKTARLQSELAKVEQAGETR
jgi:hypothetical protein